MGISGTSGGFKKFCREDQIVDDINVQLQRELLTSGKSLENSLHYLLSNLNVFFTKLSQTPLIVAS